MIKNLRLRTDFKVFKKYFTYILSWIYFFTVPHNLEHWNDITLYINYAHYLCMFIVYLIILLLFQKSSRYQADIRIITRIRKRIYNWTKLWISKPPFYYEK